MPTLGGAGFELHLAGERKGAVISNARENA